MDDSTSLQTTVESFLSALNSDALPTLDFDHLAGTLREIADALRSNSDTVSELAMLREDYIRRINGMSKAIAAVSRNRNALSEAVDQLDSCKAMPVSELIACYRTTGARFRDSFPSSFGLLATPTDKPRARHTYSHYK